MFMLNLRSMTNAENDLWGQGILFTERVTAELDYEEFSGTHLIPSLIVEVYVLASLISLQ